MRCDCRSEGVAELLRVGLMADAVLISNNPPIRAFTEFVELGKDGFRQIHANILKANALAAIHAYQVLSEADPNFSDKTMFDDASLRELCRALRRNCTRKIGLALHRGCP